MNGLYAAVSHPMHDALYIHLLVLTYVLVFIICVVFGIILKGRQGLIRPLVPGFQVPLISTGTYVLSEQKHSRHF